MSKYWARPPETPPTMRSVVERVRSLGRSEFMRAECRAGASTIGDDPRTPTPQACRGSSRAAAIGRARRAGASRRAARGPLGVARRAASSIARTRRATIRTSSRCRRRRCARSRPRSAPRRPLALVPRGRQQAEEALGRAPARGHADQHVAVAVGRSSIRTARRARSVSPRLRADLGEQAHARRTTACRAGRRRSRRRRAARTSRAPASRLPACSVGEREHRAG